ncbi:16S rRNA (cytosine(1402)-N(4))-methyltransferase RsmH [Acetomicrobium hydrogeniformans]|jgi:16S rRNA (cytosine1402-N4)-methyltransferase|uniref:Ribosomal RNA small subunit methyltransferase H n=1 Tax=Acetomicrobium hydrogeniformans ATCC BAA-1850 TaxID=592015 RepID=A0A0T5XDG0_9BACT|nr:16S rRNA (cytosine(1402)-N(4))-methyltransferase RsmH [Acetomicrobium hydrogeniformans]KRT36276.1 S-adenosyl-methyltransferase MraW [Acetomicrobium hydrogeniformans ATCC BAA-1850]
METIRHVPVLTNEIINILSLSDDLKLVVDATVGLGGHAYALLSTFPDIKLLGLDQDETALEIAYERLKPFGERVLLVKSNFRFIDDVVKNHFRSVAVDAILFDLGVSSLQIDDEERGFSFNKPGPIDMRMDREAKVTAFDIINNYCIKDLSDIFYKYGEERYSRQIAKAIVRYREQKGLIASTAELVEIIRRALPAKIQRQMGKHPARRVFQALRIVVNDELGALESGLKNSLGCLRSGGHLIVISYHSLEDRIVKHSFKDWEKEGIGKIFSKKPILPKREEIEGNPRSRSAKLRVLIKS